MVFAHEVHRGERLFKMSRAAAAVIGVLKALDADRDDEVAHALELVAEGLVDERAVREGVESDVAVLFAQAEYVRFAQERCAAVKRQAWVPSSAPSVSTRSISSKVRFCLWPYSAAQQPAQRILQALVGSMRTIHGMLQSYFSEFARACWKPRKPPS